MVKLSGLGILASLAWLMAGTSWAGEYRSGGNNCHYSAGFNNGPIYPRPFFGAPVVGYSTWGPMPIVTTRTVIYQTSRPVYGEASGTLVRAQKRLAKLGYYNGIVDGDFGPQTARALRVYQSDNGLPVTGRLDRRTQQSLGV